ncbi:uncharacterized protein AKAME5_001783400 [Lates japonicus]|uniref:Uncharacterized protein n=1 Tax=Lates japonicus TaxID=270547 RepID=A0AAD3N6Z2_LATJO|nr:uncharacterized protein AKAME5_001783400 [Lates japonicus]
MVGNWQVEKEGLDPGRMMGFQRGMESLTWRLGGGGGGRGTQENNCQATYPATCRNPDGAAELRGLAGQHPGRVSVLRLDVNREEDIRGAAEQVKESFGRLDLIVNASAMLHPSGKGETSLRDVSAQGIISTLTTNTVGPLVMAKYFAPLLQKGGGGFGQQPAEKAKQHSGIIVNITAKVGSIGDNGLGGWYSYRMSKAALNMATRNLSIELGRSRPKVVCVSLHPGTVNTDLSRPYHRNVPKDKLFSTEHSVNCLMSIVDMLNIEKACLKTLRDSRRPDFSWLHWSRSLSRSSCAFARAAVKLEVACICSSRRRDLSSSYSDLFFSRSWRYAAFRLLKKCSFEGRCFLDLVCEEMGPLTLPLALGIFQVIFDLGQCLFNHGGLLLLPGQCRSSVILLQGDGRENRSEEVNGFGPRLEELV